MFHLSIILAFKLTGITVISVLFTFALGIHAAWQQKKGNNPFAGHGKAYTIGRLVLEILTFLLWVGSAVLALRPHGGCDFPKHRGTNTANGQDTCWKHEKGGKPNWKYTSQPIISWDIAIACSLVEVSVLLNFLADIY